MPQSMVLHVKMTEDCDGTEFPGGIVQAPILSILAKCIPADKNVNAKQLLKSYTFSPLYLGERSPRPLNVKTEKGTLCWFRFSCLEEEVSDHLFNSFYQDVVTNHLESLETKTTPLKLVRAISSPTSKYPWVGNLSIDKLHEEASQEENEALIDFASPTVYVLNEVLTPLPIPSLVYAHAANIWNTTISKYQIPPEHVEFFEKNIIVVSFKTLSTSIQPLKGNKFRVGFTGKVRFRLINTKDPEIIRSFNLLSDAMFFMGAGQNVSMGCGMAKRVPRDKWALLRDSFK